MTGTLDSLFAWLDAEVGVAEVNHQNVVILRDGSNLWRDYFGYQPPASQAAWCALFQSVADWKNGTPIPPIQFSKGFVGVDAGREWFRQHGLLVSTPQPGYLAFYNEHVGRVRRITGPSTFDAIEGNEGDAVRVVHRSLSDIVGGFGVRTYPTSPLPQEEDDMKLYVRAEGDDRTFEVGSLWLTWVPTDGVLQFDSQGHPKVVTVKKTDAIWFRPEAYIADDGTVKTKPVSGMTPKG